MAVAVRNGIRTVPLEEHPAGPDVDLLDDSVEYLLVRRAAHRGEIRRSERVREDQRGVLRREEELVEVREVAIGRLYRRDLLVVVAVDIVRSVQAAALEPRQHRPAVVGLGPEVGGE